MKKLIKNLSNTQKKIIAVLLTVTFPFWVLIVFPLFILFGIFALIYANFADALGVK
jgi:hypothetical protein